MLKDIAGILRSINPWHYLWIAVILSEIFTFLTTSLQSHLRYGFISGELLIFSAVDALFVPVAVAPIVIYFVARTKEITRTRDRLLQEIGERNKIEEELRKEKVFTERALNALQEIFFVINPNGKFLRWNDAIKKVTGYNDEEISVMKPVDFFPAEEGPRVTAALADIMESGQAELETLVLTKDGGRIPFMFTGSLLVNNEGRKIGISGTGTNISEHKKTEALLRESEAKFRDMAEKSLAGIYLIQDGVFRYSNPRLAEIFGYVVEEIIDTKGPENLVFPEDWPVVRENLRKRISAEIESAHYNFRGMRKDGKIIHVEAYGSRTTFKARPAVIGMLIDITNRVQAEKEREQYFNLFQNSSDLMVIADPNGAFMKTNPACTDTLGYSETELVARPFVEFVHPGDRQRTIDEMARQLETGSSFNFENRYLCKDDSVRVLSWRAIYDPKGGLTYATARDITEEKRAVEALRLANAYNRSLIEASLDPLVTIGKDGKITDVNAAAEVVTGCSRDELIGSDFSSYFTETEKARAVYQQVFKKGNVRDYPLNIRHNDGHVTPVLYNASVYRDEGGEVIGVFAAARDITERKKLEEQLRQAQKMEAVGQLAGGIAHDFNNILGTVIGYAHLVREGLAGDHSMKAHMQHILDAAERATTLTHSLLAFSRKQLIDLRPVNLNEVVAGSVKLLKRLIGEDIAVETIPGREDPVVLADKGQLEQVLMNLATNARDAMPGGGVLTVTTGITEIDDSFVRCHGYGTAGTFAVIGVSDTGMGMSKEITAKIFEPFFTTKEPARGTGLGLFVAYGIIKQHEGFINVYSESGKGTTFRVYLPLIRQRKDVLPAVSAEPATEGGNETILVAEDDIQLRKLAEIVLKEYGYNVILAENGEEAVRKFNDNRDSVELLLLDMIMPKKGGKEAYEEIKKIRPDVKVLFVSGYTVDRVSRDSLLEEGLHFVLKPVAPKDLLRKIREILDEGR